MLHDRQTIHQVPALHNAPVRIKAMQVPKRGLNLHARRRNAHNSRIMSGCGHAATHHPNILGKHVLDDDLNVRPRRIRLFEKGALVFSARRGWFRHDLMVKRVVGQAQVEIARIEGRFRSEVVRLVALRLDRRAFRGHIPILFHAARSPRDIRLVLQYAARARVALNKRAR